MKGGFKTFFWTDPNSNLIYGHAEVCVCDTASSNCNLIQDVSRCHVLYVNVLFK